jgi:O-antigen/teichoic acid export membrane protein
MIGTSGLVLFSRFLSGLLLNSAYYEAWRYMPTLLCAAAIESVVSFLATVYMVRKKSMHSFLTAMVGTLANLLLNFFLIPRIGALGAALATMASYFAVMLVRLFDVRRMIPFRLCLPRLCVSSILLTLAAVAMTCEVPGRLWWTAGLTLVIVALNAPALWDSFKGLLRFRGKKGT